MAASEPAFQPLPTELQQFHSHTVRGFLDEEVEPWWVALGVCEVLSIANHRDALIRLKPHQKRGVGIPDAIGLGIINPSFLAAFHSQDMYRSIDFEAFVMPIHCTTVRRIEVKR